MVVMMSKPCLIWSFVAMALLLAMSSCHQDKNVLVLEENAPTQSMKDATIQYTDSGQLQMIMWGEEILNYDDEDQTQEFPNGVKATFYDEFGQITTVITANEGTNFQKKKLMNLRKNVVINDLRKGTITYTEDFYWNQDTRRIYSNVAVRQVGKDGLVQRGTGFESDEEMNDFRIRQPRFEVNMD